MGKKEYLGIALDGDLLKIARIRKQKYGWELVQLNRISIKEDAELNRRKQRSKEMVKEYDEDFHFGLDQHYDEKSHSGNDLELMLGAEEGAEDPSNFNSNVTALTAALEELNRKKLEIGIVVRAGDTDFQVLKDKDYGGLKKKEVQVYVEKHLKKVYGSVPESDNYKYEVREDGSLMLMSYKEKPYLVKMMDGVRHLYSGKIKIRQLLPDELVLNALVKKNYELETSEITCVIHTGFNRSRVFFMRGHKIIHTISPIDEGRGSANVLKVLFSKILFQLETGEVPGLDRILVTNNDHNETSLKYFRKQFPDIDVEEFHFRDDQLLVPDDMEAITGFFTSAIGGAMSAGGTKDMDFTSYSMLPAYIRERQNVFKLRWHGFVLLLLLMATPVVWNMMYEQKQQEITNLDEELFRTEYSIADLEPVVNESNEIQQLYQSELEKLELLTDLKDGVTYWSQTLKILNDGLGDIKHVWIDRVQYVEDGFILQGYSMTRDRIPNVTNLFNQADLQAVTVVEMSEVRLYKFTIKVYYDFTDDLESKFAGKTELAPKAAN